MPKRVATVRHRRAKTPPGSTKKKLIELPIRLHEAIDQLAEEEELSWNAVANRVIREHPSVAARMAGGGPTQ